MMLRSFLNEQINPKKNEEEKMWEDQHIFSNITSSIVSDHKKTLSQSATYSTEMNKKDKNWNSIYIEINKYFHSLTSSNGRL